jgi:acetoin utilization protein AcuB
MMQQNLITVTPTMSLAQVQRLMHDKHIRHLPVVRGRHLVGIVTDRDIRDALPSSATTLSKGEIQYQLDTTPVRTCMSRDVVTVHPDDDMVQAARILLDHKYGCVPVMEEERLVGLITETDCLQAFLVVANG